MKGNSVSICGNITRDAEIKELASGSVALSFGVAWNSSRKVGDKWEDVPNYFDVKCYMTERQWASVGSRCSFAKGNKVAIIDGHLAYRTWETDGQRRSKVEIVVDDPMNGLLTGERQPSQREASVRQDAEASIYDEDIPF